MQEKTQDEQRLFPPPFDRSKTYRGIHVRVADGKVCEVFQQPDDGFAMEDRFHPDLEWIDVTDVKPIPAERWLAEKSEVGVWTFSPPPGQ